MRTDRALPGRTVPISVRLLCALLLLSGAPPTLKAQEAQEAQEAREAPTKPPATREVAAWTGAAATALAGAYLLDETVRRGWAGTDDDAWNGLSDRLNHLGRPKYALVGLGALYAGGRLGGKSGVSDAAWHTLAALAASGVANGSLKYAVGRARPHEGLGNMEFDLFSPDDRWQSFPSGHTVVVFSLAASVAEEADRPWVSVLSYGTAALVGWSRIYEDRHWASDVVGGAIVGITASKATLRWLHGREGAAPRVAVSPAGIAVSVPTR